MEKKLTREEWMNRAIDEFKPEFEKLGLKLPPTRISTGFTSGGRRGAGVAECWTDKADAERHHQIFIDPRDDEPIEVLNSIAHELIHCAVGLDKDHGPEFAKVALAFGMKRPMTDTPSGPGFKKMAQTIIKKIGPYPHKRLEIGRGGMSLEDMLGQLMNGTVPPNSKPVKPSTIITSGSKPQKGRLIKVHCESCGYTMRSTRKWITIGVPCCPNPKCGGFGSIMSHDMDN